MVLLDDLSTWMLIIFLKKIYLLRKREREREKERERGMDLLFHLFMGCFWHVP